MRTSVSIPNSSLSDSSAISIIQDLMEGFGWQNMSSSIYEADAEQHLEGQKLATAIKFYLEKQDAHSRSQLIAALNETLQAAQFEYDHAIKQQQYYQKQAEIEAEQKSVGTSSYLAQWSYWMFDGIKNFFGSTAEQQIEKYQQIADARQARIEIISHSLQTLLIDENDSELTDSPSLDTSTAHFPAVIELASLNGIQGFKLNGENAGDQSGYVVSLAGDINKDGYGDLLIDAISASPYNISDAGIIYVVFGSSTIGSSGIINLSSLNGITGFKLNGLTQSGHLGFSANTAQDINGDNYSDFISGCGCYDSSYIVFGSQQIVNQSSLNVSSLNGGKIGFSIYNQGESFYYLSAGNLNNDTYSDLVLGGTSIQSSDVYVVYGSEELGNNGEFDMRSLNGQNGYKINITDFSDGMPMYYSPAYVAGDINGDKIDDIIIGVPGASPNNVSNAGTVFVIFGRKNITNGELFNLIQLNGNNGFTINGKNSFDILGSSVGGAGDINGDGYADLIMSIQDGTYVIFGNPSIGKNGQFDLSSLDGKNGFHIERIRIDISYTGVVRNDFNGDGFSDVLISYDYLLFGNSQFNPDFNLDLDGSTGIQFNGDGLSSASYAGDVNGDGVDDIIIGAGVSSPNDPTLVGQSYVIFGDIPPVLVNNSLYLDRGEQVLLTLINLAAFDKNHNNNSLTFAPTNITHGYFENINQLGILLINFTQQQVKDQQIRFIHDGSLDSPTYNITVRSSGIAWTGPSMALINFNSMPIILINNKLIIDQNQTIQISTENLLAVCNISGVSLEFVITNITHGLFRIEEEIIQSPVVSFSQQLVSLQKISFSHDGSIYAPGYQVSVNDSWIQTEPEIVNVTFFLKPILSINQFLISLNQSILLSLNNLCANDCYSDDFDELQFNVVDNVTSGQFENTSIPGIALTSFTQKNIKKNQVKFVSNGAQEAPHYQLNVTDPVSLLSDSSDGSTLLVTKNYLPINQNQTFYLTSENLNVTGSSGSATNIIFSPVTVQHGYFSLVSELSVPITTFKQDQVIKNQIAFVPDGSSNEPSCFLSVRDSQSPASGSFSCEIDFASYPHLDHAFLKINPPDSIQLTISNLEASDDRIPPEQLYFRVSDIENDHFAYSNNFNKPITNFTQAEISAGRVYFIATSDRPPAFTVTLWNGRLYCQDDCPRVATIVAPDVGNEGGINTLLIGLLSSFGTLVLLPLAKCYFEKAVKAYFSSREDTPDSQVTNEALAQLWIGCCGIITHQQHEAYIIAFGHVIDKLSDSKQVIPIREKWQHSSDRQKREIKSVIAEESKAVLVGEQSRLCRFFKSFCSSEATPEKVERQAQQIADQASLRLSQLFSSAHTIPQTPSINSSGTTPLLVRV